jgi:hypothetical protein
MYITKWKGHTSAEMLLTKGTLGEHPTAYVNRLDAYRTGKR